MADKSLLAITIGLGAAGAGKLAGIQITKDNFAKWGYPKGARIAVGGIEVGIAAAALAAQKDPEARPVAAVGTLCAMSGALATHARAGDSPLEMIPAAALAAAGLAALISR
jgi:hypothetical protein